MVYGAVRQCKGWRSAHVVFNGTFKRSEKYPVYFTS